jgi:hypothetical protein
VGRTPKIILAVSLALLGALSGGLWPGKAQATDPNYEDYAAVLSTRVNQRGLVDYRGLTANPQQLNSFLAALADLSPETYQKWGDQEKIALWINAYNALTLKAIIDHYPIRAALFKSLVYPRNSIRQIPGVWDSLGFPVMGKQMTLDDIEHGVLRQEFNEPRIHLALVCAALGCPPLRVEPYAGDRLERQLDDQARAFLANPKKFRIDRGQGTVYLSPIFKWFGGDFLKTFGTDQAFKAFSPEERAVLNFITPHLVAADRDYLLQGKYRLSYLDYDWSLNEQ